MQKKELDITFVLGSLTGGGAERVASIMINHWVNLGRRVKLITTRGPEHDFFPVSENVERFVLGGEGESGNKWVALIRNLFRILRLRRAIIRSGSPVVISFLTKTNISTIFATAGLKQKVIISERSDTSKQRHPWPWPWLREKFYRYADAVTANSNRSVEDMKRYVPQSKLSVLPNPIEIPSSKATPDQSSRIIHAGRLVPVKCQVLIVEAFARISDQYPEWGVDILGEGGEREPLERKIQDLRQSGRVLLHGRVENIASFYEKSAIFLLTSEYEGLPNALLEAMAYGIPSIVPDGLPGIQEFIEHERTGLLFRQGDGQDLANKISTLIEDPELRAELGSNARRRVESFTPDKVNKTWSRLIESVYEP